MAKIRDKHFDETIIALHKAADRLSHECLAAQDSPMHSVWMEIQVIGNVVTTIYRELYEQDERTPDFTSSQRREAMSEWIDVKQELPPEGEANRVPLYLGRLKYPFRPHVVYGYREGKRWFGQWGEMEKNETPTLWFRLPPVPQGTPEKEQL